MDILISTHRYQWSCPDCGDVEDQTVEVQADRLTVGRWFEDGHQGFVTFDERAIEKDLLEYLEISFLTLEEVRAERSLRRLAEPARKPGLDARDRKILDDMLAERGHIVQRQSLVFSTLS